MSTPNITNGNGGFPRDSIPRNESTPIGVTPFVEVRRSKRKIFNNLSTTKVDYSSPTRLEEVPGRVLSHAPQFSHATRYDGMIVWDSDDTIDSLTLPAAGRVHPPVPSRRPRCRRRRNKTQAPTAFLSNTEGQIHDANSHLLYDPWSVVHRSYFHPSWIEEPQSNWPCFCARCFNRSVTEPSPPHYLAFHTWQNQVRAEVRDRLRNRPNRYRFLTSIWVSHEPNKLILKPSLPPSLFRAISIDQLVDPLPPPTFVRVEFVYLTDYQANRDWTCVLPSRRRTYKDDRDYSLVSNYHQLCRVRSRNFIDDYETYECPAGFHRHYVTMRERNHKRNKRIAYLRHQSIVRNKLSNPNTRMGEMHEHVGEYPYPSTNPSPSFTTAGDVTASIEQHLLQFFTSITLPGVDMGLIDNIRRVLISALAIAYNTSTFSNTCIITNLVMDLLTTGPMRDYILGQVRDHPLDDGHPPPTAPTEQSGFDTVRSYMNSPAFKHFSVISTVLATIGFVSPSQWRVCDFDLFRVRAMNAIERAKPFDFFESVLVALGFFWEQGWKCFEEKSLSPLMASDDDAISFAQQVAHIGTHVGYMRLGTYEERTGLNECHLSAELDKLEKRGRMKMALAKNLPLAINQVMISAMSKLTSIMTTHRSILASQTIRMEPFALKLYGTSGVGKSAITQKLIDDILSENNFPYGLEVTQHIPTTEKFWDNVRANTLAYIMDDVCNAKTKMISQDSNPISKINMIVNNTAAFVPRAEAEDKSTIPIRPKIFVASTNFEDLRAADFSDEVCSVLRRFHLHITVKVRPEFACEGRLYPEAVFRKFGQQAFPDIWLFTVKDFKRIAPNKAIEYEVCRYKVDPKYGFTDPFPEMTGNPMSDVNVDIFRAYCIARSKEHYYLKQMELTAANAYRVQERVRCTKCNNVSFCKCPKEQSGWFDNFVTPKERDRVEEACGWLASIVSRKLFRTARSLISGCIDCIIPDAFDRTVIETCDFARHLHMYLKNQSYFSKYWFHLLPEKLRSGPMFEAFYMYIHRHEVRTATYWGIALGAIVGAGFDLSLHLVARYIPIITTRYVYRIKAGEVVVNKRTGEPVPYTRFGLGTLSQRSMGIVLTLGRFGIFTGLGAAIGAHIAHGFAVHVVNTEMPKKSAVTSPATAAAAYAQANPAPVMSTVSKFLLATGTAVAIAASIKLFREWYHQSRINEHGSLDPVDDNDIRIRNGEVNPWVHVQVPAGEKSTQTAEQLCERVGNNLMCMVYDKQFCDIFFLRNRLIMMPYHCWFERNSNGVIDITGTPKTQIEAYFIRRPTTANGTIVNGATIGIPTKPYILYFRDVIRLGEKDLCYMNVTFGGSFMDMTDMFADYVAPNTIMQCVYRNNLGEIERFSATTTSPLYDVSYVRSNNPIMWKGFNYQTSQRIWKPGDCMCVSICNTKKPLICGFHILGVDDAKQGTALHVSPSDIATIRSLGLSENSCSALPPTMCDIRLDVDPKLNDTCPLHWMHEPEGVLDVVGSMGNTNTYNTNYRPSFVLESLTQHIGINKWQPPQFSKYKPWRAYLQEVVHPVQMLDMRLLDAAAEDYKGPLLSRIKRSNEVMKHIIPLTSREIVNGKIDVKYIDPMNRQTAAGFPFVGKKCSHLQITEIDEESGRLTFDWKNTRAWSYVREAEEIYLKRESTNPIFKACLKDEILPITKGEKVRVFQAAPFVLQMLIRKYFLPVARTLSVFPLLSECAVGVNSSGPEWQQLHDFWSTFPGDRMLAGDYSKWDQHLNPMLINYAFKILIDIAESCGTYTADDLTIMRGIATDIINPLVWIEGNLLRLHGSHVSGQNLTAYVNSMCNSLLLRIGAFTIEGKIFDFRKFVKAMTYGDDLLANIHASLKLNFNNYCAFLASIRVKFTDAQKKERTTYPDYITLKESDFLKRRSTYIEEIGMHLGALDLDSILKPFYWYDAKSRVSKEGLLLSAADSACFELFAHGRHTYNIYIEKLSKVFLDVGIVAPCLEVTYDERAARWTEQYITSPKTNVHTPVEDDTELLGSEPEHVIGPLNFLNWFRFARANDPTLHPEIKIISATGRTGGDVSEDVASDSETSRYNMRAGSSNEHSGVVVQFNEESPGLNTSVVDSYEDETFTQIQTPDISLNQFLERPIRIGAFWNINGFFQQSIYPLATFLNDPKVRERIHNYVYIRGTMNVKVTLTGTSFHYGKLIASYEPWPNFTARPPVAPNLSPMQLTCLPYISVDPGIATGGVLTYDILHPRNGAGINVTSAGIETPDVVHFQSLTTLDCLSDAPTGVSVNIYIWMTNVQLMTTTHVEQSGEMNIDNAHKPPTLLQRITRVGPTIGRYARSTQMMLTTAIEVLSLFGFSRPSLTAPTNFMRNRPLTNLSNTNVNDDCIKLALDSKNEMTIDPGVVGLPPRDELVIKDIAQREAYIASAYWYVGSPQSIPLIAWSVTPCVNTSFIQPLLFPPIGFASLPFEYWRGTINYRVEVIASAFHRGRLRVMFDPGTAFDMATSYPEMNLNYSYIIDLTECRNFEFCIGWATSRPYLHTYPTTGVTVQSNGVATPVTTDYEKCNGYVAIMPEQTLTTPQNMVQEGPVTILLYISAGDDFEVAVPNNFLEKYTNFNRYLGPGRDVDVIEQSGVMSEVPVGSLSSGGGKKLCLNKVEPLTSIDKMDMIHWGESIVSFRQLLKRYNLHHVETESLGGNTGLTKLRPSFPYGVGYDDYNPINIASTSLGKMTMMNYLSGSFLARRGAIRWKIITWRWGTELTGFQSVHLVPETGGDRHWTSITNNLTGPGVLDALIWNGHSGTDAVDAIKNGCLEFEVPGYSRYRFKMAGHQAVQDATTQLLLEDSAYRLELFFHNNPAPMTSLFYVAAGEDFNLHFFKYPVYLWYWPNA